MRRMLPSAREAIVVGAGVSGLTSACRLQEEGFRVRIVARSLSPNTTSDVAAALWFPFRAFPAERVAAWALASLERFRALAADPASGVELIPMREVSRREEEPEEWRGKVEAFRRLGAADLEPPYRSGFEMRVPRIEVPIYMPYLAELFAGRGGEIEELESDLEELPRGPALIVNCSGLGSRILCRDSDVHPIRGQVVRLSQVGLRAAIVEKEGGAPPTYVVPRSRDIVAGSTAEVDDWSLEIDRKATESILDRCEILEPSLRGAQVMSVRAGLRPGRSSVRLELERTEGGTVIHNYGHGGAGFTLSWGCAGEVAQLATGEIA
jgi:D-amino-acid oxidase